MFGVEQRFEIIVYDGYQTEIGGDCIVYNDNNDLAFRLDDGRVVSTDACMCYSIKDTKQMNSQTNHDKENNFVNAQTNLLKETTLNPQTNQDKEGTFVTINANNLNFYSDKQWEEYGILTKLDGYELDYQDDSSGWIKVVKHETIGQGFMKNWDTIFTTDEVRIHKDGTVEHI